MLQKNMQLLRTLLHKRLPSALLYTHRYRRYSQKAATKNVRDESQLESDIPIQFFGSGAASWRAKDTRSGGADKTLWYQPYVVSGSVAIFLLYFCVLREENDIDQKLQGSLFDHVSGLEETQLKYSYKYNKENNLETTDLKNRLSELGVDVNELDREIQKQS